MDVMNDIEPGVVRAPKRDNRNIRTSENDGQILIEKVAYVFSMILVILLFPLSMFVCVIVVNEYQRAVIFRLGRLRKGGARGPGVLFVLPCIDSWTKVDLRTASINVPPQEILTKDSVTIKLDAVVYYSISNPLNAVIQIANARSSTNLLAQTTLRNVAGTRMLTELLTDKDTLSLKIQTILDEATESWGVKVERVEIKQIILPQGMQRAMAVEQEAIRDAKAKIAAADGELQASGALKAASDIMGQNAMALQLRYLQTLSTISDKQNQTIIFPFPLDLLRRMGLGGRKNANGPGRDDKPIIKPLPPPHNSQDNMHKDTKETMDQSPKDPQDPGSENPKVNINENSYENTRIDIFNMTLTYLRNSALKANIIERTKRLIDNNTEAATTAAHAFGRVSEVAKNTDNTKSDINNLALVGTSSTQHSTSADAENSDVALKHPCDCMAHILRDTDSNDGE